FCFFFQAEDGIRDYKVTGVQTCALPISPDCTAPVAGDRSGAVRRALGPRGRRGGRGDRDQRPFGSTPPLPASGWVGIPPRGRRKIGRASCRERVWIAVVGGRGKEKERKK